MGGGNNWIKYLSPFVGMLFCPVTILFLWSIWSGPIVNSEIQLDIFNFSMEKVHTRAYNLNNYHGAIKWDGRGQDGKHVSNGVYFARLNFAYSKNRAPADFWTKLIVVK